MFRRVFLAIQAMFLVWTVTGISGAAGNCDGRAGQSLQACQADAALGAGVGLAVNLFFWAVVDIVLATAHLLARRR